MLDAYLSLQTPPVVHTPGHHISTRDSLSIIRGGSPILYDLSWANENEHGHRRQDERLTGANDGYHQSPSIQAARERVLRLRRSNQGALRRQRAIFAGIMAMTILFPPLGILALYGKFDSTLSWCTHGELDSLSLEQRESLRRQVLLYSALYPSIIVGLAVYYSVHN